MLMITELVRAKLLLQTVQHGDIPYSIPGIPGPNGLPQEHIRAAVKKVKDASKSGTLRLLSR
jgi:hypothetical protein